jgi:ABC-type glycerol-3-phosphate transport system substrate-binding protein
MVWIKRTLMLALAGVAVFFLCLGGAAPETIPAGFVVVEYWEKWVGNEGAQMKSIVDDFNHTVGRDKHIFVRYLPMSTVDQKTLVSIAAGDPPDIAGIWDHEVPSFASLGALECLDDLAAARGINDKTYWPVFWNDCTYQGHLYGLISTPSTITLNYNKKMFHDVPPERWRAVGLDPNDAPNRAPRTLQELDQYAAAIDSVDAAGHRLPPGGMLDHAGYIPLYSWYNAFLPYWFGGKIFDDKTQKFTLTSPETVKSFEWIASYTRRLGRRPMSDFQGSLGQFDSPQNPFLVQKVAMVMQGTWMGNYVYNLRPAMSEVLLPRDQEWKLPDRRDNYEWGVAPFPAAVPGLNDVTCTNVDIVAIPRGAHHKNEAFEFLAYLCRQDVTEKLNSLHSKNSPLRKVSPEFLKNHPNPYIDISQQLAASPHAVGIPRILIWTETAKELTDAAQAIGVEGGDPATVLAGVQARLQEKYDRYHAIEVIRQRMDRD